VVISVKKGARIVCHHDDKDLYAAIDLMIDKAEIQLTKHKEKLQSRRPGGRGEAAEPGATEGGVDETDEAEE
jgi:ribosome-associated translation inhibitor RaiA